MQLLHRPFEFRGMMHHDACVMQRLGYTARSAFKLLELQKRFSVIPRNGRILDLGCHPGAWMQVACFTLGKRGGQGII